MAAPECRTSNTVWSRRNWSAAIPACGVADQALVVGKQSVEFDEVHSAKFEGHKKSSILFPARNVWRGHSCPHQSWVNPLTSSPSFLADKSVRPTRTVPLQGKRLKLADVMEPVKPLIYAFPNAARSASTHIRAPRLTTLLHGLPEEAEQNASILIRP